MTSIDLRDRLVASANELKWPTEEVPDFVSPKFRGRNDESTSVIADAYGIRLGAYPVIIAPIHLGTVAEMKAALKPLHSQMVIARSYMSRAELINAHIFLCAVSSEPDSEWRKALDLAERDETVCRKLIWVPDTQDIEASYQDFCNRTFLAAPWEIAHERKDAALDLAQGLASSLLLDAGLNRETADKWISIVNTPDQDAGTMVERLVLKLGESR